MNIKRYERARVRMTAREHEVMTLALEGLGNKEIAARLGISHRTVETHKARFLRKMGAHSVMDLIRSVDEQLRADAQELDDLYQNAPCGYHSIGPDGTILRINDTLLRWLGRQRDELVNKVGIGDLLAPEATRRFAGFLAGITQPGKPLEFRAEMVRQDGSSFPVAMFLTAICDDQQRLRKYRAMVADLTDAERESRQHKEIRDWRELYRTVVEDQTELICRFIADGTVVFVNSHYAKFFGTTADAIIGSNWQPIAHADDIEHIEAKLRTLTPENPVVVIENRVYSGTGEVRWMQFVNRAFFEGGVMREVQSVGRDITASKLHEEQNDRYRQELEGKVAFGARALSLANEAVEASDRVQYKFLSSVGHQVRTPMNGIMGMAYLARRLARDAQQIDYLDKLTASATQLMSEIEHILELSKTEAERIPLRKERLKLAEVTERVRRRLRGYAASKNLGLGIEMAEELASGEFRGDAEILEQILYSLTENAIKFTREGAVTLRATTIEQTAGSALIGFEVIDTGCGLGAEDQRRLFLPFDTGNKPADHTAEGNGVGLSLCRRLVKAMGGEIGVASREGAGSRFWFRISLETADPQPSCGVPPAGPKPLWN